MKQTKRTMRHRSARAVPAKAPKSSRASGRRSKRAANKEKTRGKILRAALEVFRKKGFFRATTKEISNKAGIAEGTLFNYFKNKEELALYFFDNELTQLVEWFQANKALQAAPLAEKLFAIILHHLEKIAPYEDFIGAVYLSAFLPVSRLNPLRIQSQEHNLRYLRFIQQVIDESADAGVLSKLGDLGAYAFGMFHFAVISFWLQDTSRGKERTLALVDRSLNLADSILTRRTWKW